MMSMCMGAYQDSEVHRARPYAKYVSYGKDKIYLTYTTGHRIIEIPISFTLITHRHSLSSENVKILFQLCPMVHLGEQDS